MAQFPPPSPPRIPVYLSSMPSGPRRQAVLANRGLPAPPPARSHVMRFSALSHSLPHLPTRGLPISVQLL